MAAPSVIDDLLQGVDVRAAAASFHSRLNSLSRTRIASSIHPPLVKPPHRPHPDSIIHPSTLRPHVIASDRLICWSSPHGVNYLTSLEDRYPRPTVFRLFQVMLQSLDSRTRSNYGAGLLRFTQFCDDNHIPELDRMPASSQLLALFSAHHAGCSSDKTLNNWLAGLHIWHTVNGAPWNGDNMLHHIWHGFSKLVPPLSRHAKRPPVTLEALCILHDCLDLSNSFDLTVWALASVAFWCCCRLVRLLFLFLFLIFPLVLGNFSFLISILLTLLNTFLVTSFPSRAALLTTVRDTLPFTFPGPKLRLTTVLTFPSPLAPTALAHFTCSLLIFPAIIPFRPLHPSSPFAHPTVGRP